MSASFTLATIAMLGVCSVAGRLDSRAEDVAVIAAIVAAFVAFSRVVADILPAPASMMFYPLQDALMVLICMAANMTRPAAWARSLSLCFVGQLVLHAWFWLGNDGSRNLLYSYILSNNVLFGVELAILSIAGGRYVAGYALGRPGLPRGGRLVSG